jgi:hypothetical protein
MPRYLILRFDVTGLTEAQIDTLRAKRDTEYCAEVCRFCGAVIEDGQCGGEGEGICTELMCVSGYRPQGGQIVEAYVIQFCQEKDIKDTLVPYRNDGLTYYQQLAYLVREYHDLPHPTKMSRRLP